MSSLMEHNLEVMMNLGLELTIELEWMKTHWDEWSGRKIGEEQIEILYKESVTKANDRCTDILDKLNRFGKVIGLHNNELSLIK